MRAIVVLACLFVASEGRSSAGEVKKVPQAGSADEALKRFLDAAGAGDVDRALHYLDAPVAQAIQRTAEISQATIAFEQALDKKFGKLDKDAKKPFHLRWLTKADYGKALKQLELRVVGTKPHGEDWVLVTVWQKGAAVATALERRMFAVRRADGWKLRFHHYFGMRRPDEVTTKTGRDGNKVEVTIESFDADKDKAMGDETEKLAALTALTVELRRLTREVETGKVESRERAEQAYAQALQTMMKKTQTGK